MLDRTIHFENIHNARDLGGIQVSDGKTIRWGLLLRSAALHGATEADREKLANAYHLAKIIDLRTGTERRQQPDAQVAGAEHCPIPIFDERMAGISHETNTFDLEKMPRMEDMYPMLVRDANYRKNFGIAARTAMEQDFSQGAVLWHCTEGKDRCGLLAAILLMALGVDREQIMEDYLLTNVVNKPKAEAYYTGMLERGYPMEQAETVRDVFLAKPIYLQNAFDAIDGLYATPEEFLTKGLEIPEETILRFRERLLIGHTE